jgi:hypothetical protein
LLLLAPLRSGAAQDAPRLVRVEGVAFDSLHRRPLRDAQITVLEIGRTAVSDDKGRFRLDSVPEGQFTFTVQHAAFDSAGLSGATARVTVRRGGPKVTLALPSFHTLWKAACGDAPIPNDSAFVYGTVRNAATGKPAADAYVEAAWNEILGGGSKSLDNVTQRRWRRFTISDARGDYVLCGVGEEGNFGLRVGVDSVNASDVMLPPTAALVRRHDLVVMSAPAPVTTAVRTPGDTIAAPAIVQVATGVVTGFVTNSNLQPVANALVQVDTLPEVRSADDGRFFVRGVPAGTRQLSITAVGLAPYLGTINLMVNDTARTLVRLDPVSVLEPVRITANRVVQWNLDAVNRRLKSKWGDYLDSTKVARMPSVISALQNIPGVMVRGRPGFEGYISLGTRCATGNIRFRLDNHPTSMDVLGMVDPREIAMIEVYKRPMSMPADVMQGPKDCVILVWTKRALGKE